MKRKNTKKRKRNKYVSRYNVGGMYNDNTVTSAGQGNNSTANIVYEESNPKVLQEKLNFLNQTRSNIADQNKAISEEIKAEDDAAQEKINTAGLQERAKSDAVGQTIQSTQALAEQSGLVKKQSLSEKLGLSKISSAYKGTRAANLGAQATTLTADGSNIITNAGLADKAVASLPKGHQLMSSAETGKTIVVDAAGNVVKQGSALGAGLKAAASNPNVLALAAQYGGKGIKALADDKDETTWTFGEATGDTLSKAGEYAGYGAMLGSVVPGVGNVAGAIGGAIVGTGVGIYQGLTGRGKARRQKNIIEQNRARKVKDYNKKVTENLISANAAARAGEIKQKTYSGYDLGRNVVARMGGMRMGMPRYGNAV